MEVITEPFVLIGLIWLKHMLKQNLLKKQEYENLIANAVIRLLNTDAKSFDRISNVRYTSLQKPKKASKK